MTLSEGQIGTIPRLEEPRDSSNARPLPRVSEGPLRNVYEIDPQLLEMLLVMSVTVSPSNETLSRTSV